MPHTAFTSVQIAPAYGRDADLYDTRTRAYQEYRQRVVDELPLRPGDVVLDVGCGTGLCFDLVRARIGSRGRIVGVDAAPRMLEAAAARASAVGPRGVELIEAPVEEAELPDVDHALFCAVHDVMRSAHALDNVLAHVRPGGWVAAGGGKWAPPWAIAVNTGVLALHAPFVDDFAGFDQPWALLAERVPGLRVQELAMGGGYVAAGRVGERRIPAE
jgi:demethylmenaquinone methyltransferase/2-methoxy-6-polyprenyl-1,4-benzoquinol methylase